MAKRRKIDGRKTFRSNLFTMASMKKMLQCKFVLKVFFMAEILKTWDSEVHEGRARIPTLPLRRWSKQPKDAQTSPRTAFRTHVSPNVSFVKWGSALTDTQNELCQPASLALFNATIPGDWCVLYAERYSACDICLWCTKNAPARPAFLIMLAKKRPFNLQN